MKRAASKPRKSTTAGYWDQLLSSPPANSTVHDGPPSPRQSRHSFSGGSSTERYELSLRGVFLEAGELSRVPQDERVHSRQSWSRTFNRVRYFTRIEYRGLGMAAGNVRRRLRGCLRFLAWELLLPIRVSQDELLNRATLIASADSGSAATWKMALMTSLNCPCLSAFPHYADNSIS